MTDHPYTREAVERWQQGKINVFDALAELEDQRDQWRECAASLLVYAESLLAHIPDTSDISWTVLQQARSMFKMENIVGGEIK